MSVERDVAIKGLLEYHKTGVWPDLYLKNNLASLDRVQASLATSITYGVLQNIYLIDYYIAHFSSIKLNKISPYVLEAIRVGVYQILYLDKVPDSAAVNESIKLINKTKNRRASSFANGVLRTISREKDNLPNISAKTRTEALSIKYSHALWMVEAFVANFGFDETEELLTANNALPRPVIRINTLKTDNEVFSAKASAIEGVALEAVPNLPNAFYAEGLSALLKSDLFCNGYFYVQDTASQAAVSVLEPKPNERILDICAAPGGKSLISAQMMGNKGEIFSNDLYEHKIRIINDNAVKYGVDIITASVADATVFNESYAASFDKIICDVPCSGLGIIRKKPDIRFKKDGLSEDLAEIQAKILKNAAQYLKSGGTMIYTTCTILPRENENVIAAFLKENNDFTLVPFNTLGHETDGMITLLPHRHNTDGFFISKLRRGE